MSNANEENLTMLEGIEYAFKVVAIACFWHLLQTGSCSPSCRLISSSNVRELNAVQLSSCHSILCVDLLMEIFHGMALHPFLHVQVTLKHPWPLRASIHLLNPLPIKRVCGQTWKQCAGCVSRLHLFKCFSIPPSSTWTTVSCRPGISSRGTGTILLNRSSLSRTLFRTLPQMIPNTAKAT